MSDADADERGEGSRDRSPANDVFVELGAESLSHGLAGVVVGAVVALVAGAVTFVARRRRGAS